MGTGSDVGRRARLAILPGDGIGSEVTAAAVTVLKAVAARFGHDFVLTEWPIGAIAMRTKGSPLPEDTLAACKDADAILMGAVGDPAYDAAPRDQRPEAGLLGLRKALEAGAAVNTLPYSRPEVTRIVEVAFQLARGRRRKVTSVDKSNVLETSQLWRAVATEVGTRYPDVALDHQLVDSCAMNLVLFPASFDVVVTENLFGDILSDEVGALVGSLGLLPSAR